MRIRVRLLNPMYDIRSRYAFNIPKYVEYTGTVIKSPVWVSADCFCITTGNPSFPLRILSKSDIVDGYKLPDVEPVISNKTKTYTVQGSKNTYVVTEDNGKLSCNCTGFSYSKDCKHIKELAL